MFLKFGPNIYNLADAASVYSKPFNSGGKPVPGIDIVWKNGTVQSIAGRIEDVEALCGTIVPAPEGLAVIEAHADRGKVAFSEALPVVAYCITGAGADGVTPITIRGRVTTAQYANVKDGDCIDASTGEALSLADWKKLVTERLTAAKAA